MKKQMRFAVGIGVISLAIAYFAVTGYNEGKAYYKTIAEVAAMGPEAQTKRLRVAGLVKEGTIQRDGRHLSFVLAQDVVTMQHSMRVNYVGNRARPGHVQGSCGGRGRGQVPRRRNLPGRPHPGQVRVEVRGQVRQERAASGGRSPAALPPPGPRPPIRPGKKVIERSNYCFVMHDLPDIVTLAPPFHPERPAPGVVLQ